MTDGFTLYGSPHSLFTYKVALMLRLSGAPFSFRYVSFQRGMHRTTEFLAMSRWGQVPVLQHGAKTLVQSPAILEYLASALGKFQGDKSANGCAGMPTGSPHRLQRGLVHGVRLGELKLLPLSWHPEVAAYYRRNGETAWTWLDDHLAPKVYRGDAADRRRHRLLRRGLLRPDGHDRPRAVAARHRLGRTHRSPARLPIAARAAADAGRRIRQRRTVMPKRIDPKTLPVITGTTYPAPYDEPCRPAIASASATGRPQPIRRQPAAAEPGAWSSQRHWHTGGESSSTSSPANRLVSDAGEEVLRAGDCAGFKAGDPDGHHLQNRSDADATVLEIGSRVPGEAAYYPGMATVAQNGYSHTDGRPYPSAGRR